MGKKSYESLNRLMNYYGCTGIHARSASSGEPFVSTGDVSYFKMQGGTFHRDCTPEELENLKPRPRKKVKPEVIDGRDSNSKGDASDVGGCEEPSEEGLVESALLVAEDGYLSLDQLFEEASSIEPLLQGKVSGAV